ncbi:bifunctional folylpolyglutamate synthase/dihydrofolate synthase, partial [Akkermansia muciniphila]
MLTYEEALAFVNGQQRFGRRPELGRMKRLCAALGDPQEALHFIHVAGTNGKGSTTRMVASALAAAGYPTGLFISPYVVEFTERIQVDGVYIPKGRFAALASQVQQVALAMEKEGEPPNTFECVTA